MKIMQHLLQPQWLSTITAVGTGGGTAVGMSTEVIQVTTATIGALCAIITTGFAIYFHYKNYKLNKEKLEIDRTTLEFINGHDPDE